MQSIGLLDDDRSNLKGLARLLKSDGLDVEKFSEPAAFLSALADTPFRLAIMDVCMPEMNGLEVQAIVRRDSPETRVILMSGRDDPTVSRMAMEAGAFAFLSKPFDGTVLLDLARKATAR